MLLLCLCQARQDILAQDLAEAIDSQVELAEQLRCYREENEQLLAEKKGVCVCVFCFVIVSYKFSGTSIFGMCHVDHTAAAQCHDVFNSLGTEAKC